MSEQKLHNATVDVSKPREWSFSRRPFWIFSHVFAATVVTSFVFLGLWQLNRLQERKSQNEFIAARSLGEPEVVVSWPDDVSNLDYELVRLEARYVEDDFVRVANRTQGGVAGEWVVGVVLLDDGTELVVNRGFIPANADVELNDTPSGPVELTGWLRKSVAREWPGVADVGTGSVLPRLDTERVSFRLQRPVPEVWLQLRPEGEALASFPDPVPLPPLNEGSHLSYAVQWFIFATLGTAFYLAVVFRRAKTGADQAD